MSTIPIALVIYSILEYFAVAKKVMAIEREFRRTSQKALATLAVRILVELRSFGE